MYVHLLQSSESDDLFSADSDGFEEVEEAEEAELETAVKCDGEHEVKSARQPVCYIAQPTMYGMTISASYR